MTSETNKNLAKPVMSRERVITGAVELADRIGVQPLTIRKLAVELGVKPMTIYHHVQNKEDIIDGMVDRVYSEVTLPPRDLAWKEAIRVRCLSAHEVLRRHPWAAPLMETRTSPGPATLEHHNAIIGTFRRGGLSMQLTGDAFAVIDGFLYGFALQVETLPGTTGEELGELAEELVDAMDPDLYPYLVEFAEGTAMQVEYDFTDSFEVGLRWILDAIESQIPGVSPD